MSEDPWNLSADAEADVCADKHRRAVAAHNHVLTHRHLNISDTEMVKHYVAIKKHETQAFLLDTAGESGVFMFIGGKLSRHIPNKTHKY